MEGLKKVFLLKTLVLRKINLSKSFIHNFIIPTSQNKSFIIFHTRIKKNTNKKPPAFIKFQKKKDG